MKLTETQIKSKELAGTLDGKPVWLIETVGGLNLIAALKSGALMTLGAGPHRAISMYIAEKKEPAIKWAEFLTKSESKEDKCPVCKQKDTPQTCLCLYRWGMNE